MPPSAPQSQNYDFIVNPAPPPKHNPLAGSSRAVRVGVVCSGLLVLFILFSIIKGLLSGGSDVDLYLGIAQDQQELIHIASNAEEQRSLSTINNNSALTISATMATDQTATLAYMKSNGKKVNPKVLNVTLSSAVDKQLSASAEAGTYDATYASVMDQQLASYALHLQQTYKQTSGKKGHELLNKNFQTAKLLQQQLQVP